MDRDSLRGLRAQPGYVKFLSAATLARVSDEMFGVGVVAPGSTSRGGAGRLW